MKLWFQFSGLGRFMSGLGLLLMFVAGVSAQVEIWTSRYDSGQDDDDHATAMVMTSDGNLAVTGFSVGSDWTRDIATLKLDALTGEALWVRRWMAGPSSMDVGWAIATDSGGNIFVAGWTRTSGGDTNFVTIKYLSDGTQAWAVTYDNSGSDVAVAVAADNAGGCYVTGRSVGAGNYDYVTIHYDSDGNQSWLARYNGPAAGTDIPTALAAASGGAVYVTGYSWGGSALKFGYLTVKYDASGDTVWTKRYDGTASDTITKSDLAFAIALDDSENVYVTGRAGESGTWFDATTVKYNRDGGQLWVNRFDWGENSVDGTNEIALGPDRSIYCAGFTETDLGFYEYLLFKLTPSGSL
ncbi:MAG: hypothetical protein ABIK44_00950, partial [candidate division WOR-3 bacterium]